MGPRDARVTILEFADFQCPYCFKLHKSLVQLRQDTSISFRIVYRHFPLSDAHPLAVPSAEASECADEQGKFAAYHDTLFENRQLLNASDWIGVAKLAGLADTAKFKKCVASHKYAAKVDADRKVGEKLGVVGTPTLFINGRQFSGAPSTVELRRRLLDAVH
jgi:protein-disulfide isomerase